MKFSTIAIAILTITMASGCANQMVTGGGNTKITLPETELYEPLLDGLQQLEPKIKDDLLYQGLVLLIKGDIYRDVWEARPVSKEVKSLITQYMTLIDLEGKHIRDHLALKRHKTNCYHQRRQLWSNMKHPLKTRAPILMRQYQEAIEVNRSTPELTVERKITLSETYLKGIIGVKIEMAILLSEFYVEHSKTIATTSGNAKKDSILKMDTMVEAIMKKDFAVDQNGRTPYDLWNGIKKSFQNGLSVYPSNLDTDLEKSREKLQKDLRVIELAFLTFCSIEDFTYDQEVTKIVEEYKEKGHIEVSIKYAEKPHELVTPLVRLDNTLKEYNKELLVASLSSLSVIEAEKEKKKVEMDELYSSFKPIMKKLYDDALKKLKESQNQFDRERRGFEISLP